MPKRYWDILGCAKSPDRWKSTGTSDRRKAEREALSLKADLIDEVEREAALRSGGPVSPKSTQWLFNQVRNLIENPPEFGNTEETIEKLRTEGKLPRFLREGESPWAEASPAEDDVAILFHELVEEHLKARKLHSESVGGNELTTIRNAHRMLNSPDTYIPLPLAIEKHMNAKKGDINPSTLERKRAVSDDFARHAGNPEISDVTRLVAGRYVSEVLLPSALTPATKKWKIGALSAAWNWFMRKGLAESNPWIGLAIGWKVNRENKGQITHNRISLFGTYVSTISLFNRVGFPSCQIKLRVI